MNQFERDIGGRPAILEYLDGEYRVVSPGSHVLCAVTGENIPLDELKYWSVARQEPYASATASLRREIEMHPELRKRG